MKRIFKVFAAMVAALAWNVAQAQVGTPVDFMRMNPYQLKANPATELPYESVMSILIGNTSLNVQNTTLRYNNLFDFDAQGRPEILNLRKLANSLKENNFVGVDFDLNFFILGRRTKHGFFTYEHNIRTQSDVGFRADLFKLLAYGNSAFLGSDNPVNVGLKANATMFQEFAVGYQMKVNDRLSLGGRAKLLFGVVNVNTKQFDVRLFTDPDSYALRLVDDVLVRTSMPSTITLQDGVLGGAGGFGIGDLFHNPGFGVDFAAEYRFDDRFSAVAAVRDLGFISWGFNNIQMTNNIQDMGEFYDNGSFLFNGLNVNHLEMLADETNSALFLDTLQQYFHLGFDRGERYFTALNTNLLLRGNYDLDAHNRFSAQVQGRFNGSGFRPALTLAYNGYFFEKLDVCATYTIMPNSYDNIGLGISGRLFKTCNIYLTTNNVIGFFSPMNLSGMHVQFGIVFTLRPEDKNTEYE